jgi:hypothetical protein
MMVSSFVLLLMVMMRITCNVMLGLGAKRNILSAAPVDACSLTCAQLPFAVDKKAL